MKKIFLLSRMLSRGSGEGDKKSDQNADVLNIFFIIILAAGSFCAGMFLTPISSLLIPNQTIATLLAVLAALVSLVRVFPMIINGLFMSKDVEVLLTLPYSPLQLALSNSINIVKTIGLYQIAATLPFVLGIFIAEVAQTEEIINLLIMDVLFIIFIPIFVSFFIILVATLIMKGLKTMANKEFQKIIGVVFVAIAVIAYCVISFNSHNSKVEMDAVLGFVNQFSSFAWVVPVAPMIQDFIFDKNILNLLYVLLIDGGLVVVTFLALNAFYLPILMQVTNTFSNGKEVSDKTIKESSKKSSVINALVFKDIKLIFRDSGYYLNCLIMPLILAVFFMFAFYQFFDKIGYVDKIVDLTSQGGSTTVLSLVCGISLGLVCAATLAGMSGVAACSISREAHSYIFLKQMPIEYKIQLEAKKIVALIISFPVGLLIIIVFSILGIVSGYFEWMTPFIAIVVFVFASQFFINYSIMVDLKKPNLYATKLNKLTQPKPSTQIAAIIICFVSIILPMVVMMLPIISIATGFSLDLMNTFTYIFIAAVPIICVVLSIVYDKKLKTKGPVLLNSL